ncbi:hypothetical protein E2C01_096870 [Portunus trituberculatus]|uniref:Uncharacterized protein n=1 Tax=Portunus trituberculatus TaxID=210409 RepID=A0A5B7K802_PORTR|nr:hypothetical protein [Portunus trituberculatus]
MRQRRARCCDGGGEKRAAERWRRSRSSYRSDKSKRTRRRKRRRRSGPREGKAALGEAVAEERWGALGGEEGKGGRER